MNLSKAVLRIIILAVAATLAITGCSKKNSAVESKPETPEAKAVVPEAKLPSAMLIDPLAGVGKVRKGMRKAEVETELGSPDSKKGGIWAYKELGLWVLFDKSGLMFNVHCRKSFTGHTKEGIGIGSTRAEVVKAFGDPSEAKPEGKAGENLWFASSEISMTLNHDKITEIVVHLDVR